MNQQPPPGYPPGQPSAQRGQPQPHTRVPAGTYGQPAQQPPAPANQPRPFGASAGARAFGAPSQSAKPKPNVRPVQSQQTFTYVYTIVKITATLDPMTLTVKHGLRTFRVNVQQIKYLYVRKLLDGQVLLVLEQFPSGKTKLHKFYADSYAPGFQQLVDVLGATRPSADIRDMPAKQALRTMGTRDKTWLVAVGVTLAVTAASAIPVLPQLVHGLDFGESTLTVSELEKGREPDSRNLVLTDARAVFDASIKVTTVHKNNGVETSRSHSHLVPLVPRSLTSLQGHPVHVVLETGSLSTQQQVAMQRASRFEGVARDVLWEGLGGDDEEYFTNKLHVRLAEDVKLVELNENPRWGLLIFALVTGGVFLFMSFVMGVFWYTHRVKSP